MKTLLLQFLLSSLLLLSCEKTHEIRSLELPPTDLATAPLIPLPNSITSAQNSFLLDRHTQIISQQNTDDFMAVKDFLVDKIQGQTGLDLVKPNETVHSIIEIRQSKADRANNPEGYALRISQDTVVLSAPTAEGAFRGVQTLRQLIPTLPLTVFPITDFGSFPPEKLPMSHNLNTAEPCWM